MLVKVEIDPANASRNREESQHYDSTKRSYAATPKMRSGPPTNFRMAENDALLSLLPSASAISIVP